MGPVISSVLSTWCKFEKWLAANCLQTVEGQMLFSTVFLRTLTQLFCVTLPTLRYQLTLQHCLMSIVCFKPGDFLGYYFSLYQHNKLFGIFQLFMSSFTCNDKCSGIWIFHGPVRYMRSQMFPVSRTHDHVHMHVVELAWSLTSPVHNSGHTTVG